MSKKQTSKTSPHPSSFRDPSGFMFHYQGKLYRQVNTRYQQDYDLLHESGLYPLLVDKKLLIPHTEAKKTIPRTQEALCVLQPDPIPVVTYPYEWSFTQLKKAALLTLKVHTLALEHNMILKDASAYNVQFVGTQAIFIDTLSFEKYQENMPWIAYRQFCRHFLAPLALMSLVDSNLGTILRPHIDGIDLSITAKLLPVSSKLNFGLLTHIHMNAGSKKVFAEQTRTKKIPKLSKQAQINLIKHLQSTIERLEVKSDATTWQNYYNETNYSGKAFTDKKSLVRKLLKKTKPTQVLDAGANTGVFTQVADEIASYTISADIDPLAVEKNTRDHAKSRSILPLVIDLTNPSPGLGWAGAERQSFSERVTSDTVLALALLHHLAIANNIPLGSIADYFSKLGEYLIIEFVPKSDSQAKKLLSQREDIFDNYSQEGFEKAFSEFFVIKDSIPVADSERTLYLMKRK